MKWGGDKNVDLLVTISTAGPFDPPFSGTAFEVSNFGGRCYVDGAAGIDIDRGRSDEFQTFQSGTLTLTLHNDKREFDPTNASSPFISILKPLRRLQLVAAYKGSFWSLFVGYIDGWPRSWTKTTGQVEIVARDALSIMARAATSPSHGTGIFDDPIHGLFDHARFAGDLPVQLTGDRVVSLLEMAGFTDGTNLVADPGNTFLIAMSPEGNILSLIQDAEMAEAGFFFVDQAGTIRFYDRYSRFLKPRTGTVQKVLTDSQYSGLEVEFNLNQVWNDIKFSRPDGDEPQMFLDEMSLHDFGILTFEAELPVTSDGELISRAQFFASRYSQPKDRPTPIEIRPRRDMANLFPFCAGVDLLDRIQLQRTPLGIGPTQVFTGLVEQIGHHITSADWVTRLATSPIDVDDGVNFGVFDSGLFDTAEFSY